jgi:hypothetical protein
VNEVFWDNDEKTIIRQVYDQGATIADYRQAVDKTNTLLDSVNDEVDLQDACFQALQSHIL